MKQMDEISKYLCLLLRHQPDKAELDMDKQGWVSVEQLISGVNRHSQYHIDLTMLENIVSADKKGRYRFDDEHKKIKCCQGHSIIFSSSATVYGEPQTIPITENCPKGICTNPYGWTKWMIEQILTDLHTADSTYNVVLLHYFNPIGAHESGLIGENPNGIPNNFMPYITQVAVGKRDKLHIFGNDYDTPDGTGVRDYIHVVDLAKGHVKTLNAIQNNCGVEIYNLGTGKGYSVLDIVKAFERVNDVKIPYVIDDRRPGDIATCYSDPSKARTELGWKAEYGIEEMCRDSWNWQRKQ